MKLHRSLQHTFTILTYNLLAQNYIKREIYPYCARETLKWAYRRKRLLTELEAYSADLGCLQVKQGVII